MLLLSTVSEACNNHPDLCNRSYSNVTQLGAHDSPFVRNATNGFTISGDQFYDTIQQLSSGVRLVTAQVHRVNSTWRLCHSDCSLYDAGLLRDWLKKIGTWLDANPQDVVTVLLVNSDDAKASDLAGEYDAADVARLSYTPDSKSAASLTWPTFQQLVNDNKRLLSFIATLDENSAAPYLMDEFTYVFENSYSNLSPSDFSCNPDRPASLNGNIENALSSGRLPLVNHFLYRDIGLGIQIPDVGNITNTNAPDSKPGNVGASADQCVSQYNRAPVFLLLDFVNVENPIVVVDRLNGISDGITGRTPLPTDVPSTASSTSANVPSNSPLTSTSKLTTTATHTLTSLLQSSTTLKIPTPSSAANRLVRLPLCPAILKLFKSM